MNIEYQDGSKLEFFKELYEEAKSELEPLFNKLDQHIKQYKGSADIDGVDGETAEKASQVRNITYELVESQVTSYLPTPSVSPKMQSDRNERCAKSIETLLRNKRDDLPFERLNDIDERYNPIYGGSVWLVEWDNAIVTHSTVGDIKLSCLSPRHFVGQPNIYNIDDMEYCFVTFETTKEDIVRRYGVNPTVADEAESDENADEKTATLYVCYYKNDDGRICQYVWSGDTELLDLDDYFARKRKVCQNCGEREQLCKCEKPKLQLENEEFEEIERDILLSDGSVIPAMSEVIRDGQVVMEYKKQPVFEDNGDVAYEEVNGEIVPLEVDVPTPKLEPTRLPFYTPSFFPIVIRKNTSEEDALFGQSDCEFIRPQQQGINKCESRIMQKLMGSGVFPIVPEDHAGDIDNSIFKRVFRAKQNNFKLFGRIDLQVDISRDIAEAERLYDQAKRILGISDSFQGQYDASAQSGKAKQIQVQQAAGRLDSKRQMKNAAYADIDRVIFQYYLAYADEPRPGTYRDAQGNLRNRIFHRYDFILRDEAGRWYYNDQFLFRTDATVDVDKSREMLWQENRLNFQQGAYGDPSLPQSQLIFWQNMERAHYPWASDNVDRINSEIARQNEIAGYKDTISQLTKDVKKRAGYTNELLKIIKSLKEGSNNGTV